MIPTIFTLLPDFVLIKQLGMVDTLLGISLPSILMTPFAVFFLRQFFLGISKKVEEAALVEGASKTRVFFRLIIPMSSAPLATLVDAGPVLNCSVWQARRASGEDLVTGANPLRRWIPRRVSVSGWLSVVRSAL